MLIFDFRLIGNKLHLIRKRMGMTQAEVAEASGLADRTYADIERGTVNMRIETFLRICNALHVTPNEILTEDDASPECLQNEILEKLGSCSPKEAETAFKLMSIYLQSLNKTDMSSTQ
ncbi:MAG: helix-turn-helix transcriptional regulator [Clostridia bacterium]|nr:helix-turn-helix transcriptional regulator [Clostridia bacterium]